MAQGGVERCVGGSALDDEEVLGGGPQAKLFEAIGNVGGRGELVEDLRVLWEGSASAGDLVWDGL